MENHEIELGNNLTPSSFDSGLENSAYEYDVSLLCLWYASGNDWSWMLQDDIGDKGLISLCNSTHSKRHHRRIHRTGLLLTSSLTALVLWLYASARFESSFSHQPLLKPNVADSEQFLSPKSCSKPINTICSEQNANSLTEKQKVSQADC